MNRRKFIKSGIGLGAAASLTGLYSWQIAPYQLEFVKLKMPIQNLPPELIGKTLIQVSDMHVGNRFDWNYLIESLELAKAYQPDFVVYTGDFTSFESEEQYSQLQNVLKSAVLGKIGSFAVLGNHDYGHGWSNETVASSTCEILEKAGITPLRNEIGISDGINFLGMDDYWGINFGPEKIMATHDPSVANIVLCHNPDVCDLPLWNDYQGWILAGHTHGGQVKAPFLPPPILPVKNRAYSAGEIDLKDGRTLYINRALGHMYPIRFNVRPEITVFELIKA
jgi:predicted MPP superfamily phosphohydrolase